MPGEPHVCWTNCLLKSSKLSLKPLSVTSASFWVPGVGGRIWRSESGSRIQSSEPGGQILEVESGDKNLKAFHVYSTPLSANILSWLKFFVIVAYYCQNKVKCRRFLYYFHFIKSLHWLPPSPSFSGLKINLFLVKLISLHKKYKKSYLHFCNKRFCAR